jgi:hypothetical protein
MSLAERINALDFDHPFKIINGRIVDDLDDVYAPEVTHDPDNDIHIEGYRNEQWQAIHGFTGQDSYHGAVMHPSEYIGRGIADHLVEMSIDAPDTVFAIVLVMDDEEDENGETDTIGWTVVYRVEEV